MTAIGGIIADGQAAGGPTATPTPSRTSTGAINEHVLLVNVVRTAHGRHYDLVDGMRRREQARGDARRT
jgi:hypothetical protein